MISLRTGLSFPVVSGQETARALFVEYLDRVHSCRIHDFEYLDKVHSCRIHELSCIVVASGPSWDLSRASNLKDYGGWGGGGGGGDSIGS